MLLMVVLVFLPFIDTRIYNKGFSSVCIEIYCKTNYDYEEQKRQFNLSVLCF